MKTRAPHRPPARRSDGERTHEAILDAAMALASIEGLSGLTIGRLARELGISKSGLFAHFRSKQRLQQETIEAARAVFEREVLGPGLDAPEGLPRLESLCEAYLSYLERGVFPGGCLFAQLLAEFDARTGPLRDGVAAAHGEWLALLTGLAETARRQGELEGSSDPDQLAFDLYAAMELANYLSILHRDRSFIERGRKSVRGHIAGAKPKRRGSAPGRNS